MNNNHKFKAVINGNVWDLSNDGYLDIVIGHDPVKATETIPVGEIISNGKYIVGQSSPERFFIAFTNVSNKATNPTDAYQFGFGDPPSKSQHAMGGLGPIIIGKLKYGTRNLYGPGCPAGAPLSGPPGANFESYLVQRSNRTYSALSALGASKGKVAIALCRSAKKHLLLVQPDNPQTGIMLDSLREKLVSVGVDDAVFIDGSDSAMLLINGKWCIRQGDNKNEGTTTGLGFK